MKRKYNLTIEFESQELMEEFRGWFLDGGGDQAFMEDVSFTEEGKYGPLDVDYEGERTILISQKKK